MKIENILCNKLFSWNEPVYLMDTKSDIYYLKKEPSILNYIFNELYRKLICYRLHTKDEFINMSKSQLKFELDLLFCNLANDWNDFYEHVNIDELGYNHTFRRTEYIIDGQDRFYSLHCLKNDIIDYVYSLFCDIDDVVKFVNYISEITGHNKVFNDKKKINIYRNKKLYISGFHHTYIAFNYRVDPVPFIRHRSFGHWYRHPKTFNEIKQNSDVEIKEFVRKRRFLIPDAWDDLVVGSNYDRSWKSCKKVKKQWQKKQKLK